MTAVCGLPCGRNHAGKRLRSRRRCKVSFIGAPLSYLTATNYPNPFNPATTIRYSVPVQGNVKLSVFDVVGREVAVLVNQSQGAGTYAVSWDGGTSASGIYFYRLEAGNQSFTNRMLLMK